MKTLERQRWEVALRALVATLVGVFTSSVSAHAGGVVTPLPAEDQQILAAKLGPGVVGTALPSQPVDDPSLFFPLKDRTVPYLVTSGPNSTKTQMLGLSQLKRAAGKTAWRFQLSPTLAGFLRMNPGGDLVMPSVSDEGEGVIVVTTPSNPFLSKGIKPGESRSFSQTVSVNHLDDPTDQEYSGSLNGTYTYLGTFQVKVPAGTYEAVILRLKCEGKVGPAHTQDTAYYLFAPWIGVVAMISQEDVTAFWIFHIDTSSGKVLTQN
jgi:hypothetical protein